jgi:hypothetical protein
MIRKFSILISLSFLLLTSILSFSQCAMCKSSVESNAKIEVTKRSEGLNTGILYLMVLPYILFGVLGYLWYKNSKKARQERLKIDNALKKAL